MCRTPISVPNPLYHKRGYYSEFGHIFELPRQFSSYKEFIEVPCGKCSECRSTYFNSLLQRSICESMSSYMYFVTLTYDDKHIPYIDLDGNRILYFDYSHIKLLIKRLRNARLLDRDFRYLCVNEYGDTYSRPHAHLLFFVGKRATDVFSTPFDIEKILYDNLRKFFACNVGTRKNPIYEPLFTYSIKFTSSGIRSNYYVKYVEPDCSDYLKDLSSGAFIRTIRYLIGYVNTNIKIDDSIKSFLITHSHDSLLCNKLRSILSCRVRFSKGFGCGFVDGFKYELPIIHVSASSNVLLYTELVNSLPNKYDEFCLTYSDFNTKFLLWRQRDIYSKYLSLSDCLKSFTVDDWFYHVIYLRYFHNELSEKFYTLYFSKNITTISYIFNFIHYKYNYSIKKVVTDVSDSSFLYRFLRMGIEQGLNSSLPYFAFPIKSECGFVSLCKFYRERVCSIEDYFKLYNSVGVTCYDEWKDLFLTNYSTYKSSKSLYNNFQNKNNSEIILENQKKSLYLRSRKDSNLYDIFAL